MFTTADNIELSDFLYNSLGITNIQNESLGDLSNVSLTNLSDGNVLVYDNSTSRWVPSNLLQDNSSSIIELQNDLSTEIFDLSSYTFERTFQDYCGFNSR